jgi:chromate transporter
MGERSRRKYWLWLGLTSFGGPGAQLAALQAEVVERRAWLTAEQFSRALGLCFFLPGPEAQQMVTWVAWKLDGWRAAVWAALAFILPGLIGCALWGWAYVQFGRLPAVEGALGGVRAVVAGIILVSALRLGAASCKGWGPGLAAGAAFVGLSSGVPFGLIALGAGGYGWWSARAEPSDESPAASRGVIRRLALEVNFEILGIKAFHIVKCISYHLHCMLSTFSYHELFPRISMGITSMLL